MNQGDWYSKLLGRSLHWERGLKRGVEKVQEYLACRSLHWERGLKLHGDTPISRQMRRSLHWERGLKQIFIVNLIKSDIVAPFIGSVD